MREMDQKIASLAAEMGVSVDDLTSFIGCLSVWTSKGYSLADAMQKHLGTLLAISSNVSEGLAADYGHKRDAAIALRTHLAGEVWEAWRAR